MKNNKIIAVLVLLLIVVSCKKQPTNNDLNVQPKPGPAPQIKFGKAEKFKLSNGLQVIMVENHKLPRASAYLTIDNQPVVEGDKVGVSSLMGSLLGRGTKNIAKDAFNEKIDYMGANVNFSSNSASVASLKKYFPEVLSLMADAVKNSVFSEEELSKEKMQTLDRLKMSETNVGQVTNKVKDALLFGKNHAYGEFMTATSVNAIGLADVKLNYETYFKPNNAFLTIVGDIDMAETKATITKLFSDWQAGELAQNEMAKPLNLAKSEINFVNMPNAVQSTIALVNNVDLKLGDKELYAALLANNILGGGMSGRLFKNLREDKGYTYGAYSNIQLDKYGSVFSATASVRNAVTDSAIVEFRKEFDKIRKEPITDEELAITKAEYTGSFVRNIEKPETVARFALNIAQNNLPADFYENYLENINNVTKEDVQAAANKYFLGDNNRIVVVGKADDVLDNLEKVGLPIKYFDTNAKEVEKPQNSITAVDGDITAESIVNKYFEAIGGLAKVKSVKTLKTISTANMQGQQFKVISISATPNKVANTIESGGQVMQKQVFDGITGFMQEQGETVDLSSEEVKKMKGETAPFVDFVYKKATVKGIEKVNGNDAYVIELDGEKVFYDVASGLKVKSEMKQEDQQGEYSVITFYKDYKSVKGVKLPHVMNQDVGGNKIKFTVTETLINKGVTDADFKK